MHLNTEKQQQYNKHTATVHYNSEFFLFSRAQRPIWTPNSDLFILQTDTQKIYVT